MTALYGHIKRPELIDAYERLRAYYLKHAIPLPERPYMFSDTEPWPENGGELRTPALGSCLNVLLNADLRDNADVPDAEYDEWEYGNRRARTRETLLIIFRSAVNHKHARAIHVDNAGATYLSSGRGAPTS